MDDALFFDTQKVGIGFIVWDQAGKVMLAASVAKKNVDNPAVIEALVALHSFQLCMHNGFTNIILESDCLLLVEEVLSPAAPCSILGNIILDIRNLMQYFTSYCIQYASRDCNRAAHKLACNAWLTNDILFGFLLQHELWLEQLSTSSQINLPQIAPHQLKAVAIVMVYPHLGALVDRGMAFLALTHLLNPSPLVVFSLDLIAKFVTKSIM